MAMVATAAVFLLSACTNFVRHGRHDLAATYQIALRLIKPWQTNEHSLSMTHHAYQKLVLACPGICYENAMKNKQTENQTNKVTYMQVLLFLTIVLLGCWCRTHTGIMGTASVIPAAPTERVMRSAVSDEREIPSSMSRHC